VAAAALRLWNHGSVVSGCATCAAFHVQVEGASRTGHGGVCGLRRKCTPARTALAVICLLYAALGGPVLVPPGARAKVTPGERQGLVNLYLATNGPGWTGFTQGWDNHANPSVDPCDPSTTVWTGVTCSGTTSIVYVAAMFAQ
jgi:hypothetical protein